MTGELPEFQRTRVRSLIFLLLLHERSARRLYEAQIADRLDRAPSNLRLILKEAERCGLVESRLETLSEVEARNLTGYSGAVRRRFYWLTGEGERFAIEAALTASEDLRADLYRYCIRLDIGHNVPDGSPGYSDDARLILLLFAYCLDRRWQRYEVAQRLCIEPPEAHVVLTRMARMGWIAAERESHAEASARSQNGGMAGRLLLYRLTDSGKNEADEAWRHISPILRVRAHFLDVDINSDSPSRGEMALTRKEPCS
jgi:hypothetical protein